MGLCIECSDASRNTGTPLNPSVFGLVEGLFIVPLKDSQGTVFEFDSALPLDQAELDGYTNEEDVSKRLLPINGLEEVNPVRAEDNVQTFTSGRKNKLSDGVLTVTATMPNTQSKYTGQLQAAGACGGVGVYFIDDCGKIRGDARVAAKLRPIPISDDTWSAIMLWAIAGANNQSTNIVFDVATSIKDGDMGHITEDSYTADVQGANGMLDIVVTITAATASDDTVLWNVKDIYGDHFDLEGVPGIDDPDITLLVNGVGTTFSLLTDLGGGLYSGVTTVDMLDTEVVSITVLKTGLASATGTLPATA